MGQHDVVIIGAGPAGLAAANELARRGVATHTLEKNDKVGGLARTETHGGCRFDVGGHRFYTKSAEILRLWDEILGEDLLKVRRLSRICYDGKFYKYPLSAFDTLHNLGLIESALMVASYVRAKIWPIREEKTFEQWVTNRFGGRLYRTFFETYTEKVWGMPGHAVQADWAVQRIGTLSMSGAIRKALLGVNGARTLADEFLYPSHGSGMMWERLRAKIEAAGGLVETDSEVVRVNHDGRRVTGIVTRSGSRMTEAVGEHFVSTMPIADLIVALSPPAPDAVLRAARGLRHRAFVLVGLILGRTDMFPDNWIYIHTPGVATARIQNFRNWSAHMAGGAPRTPLGVEYFCNEGDSLWTTDDKTLIAMAAGELEQLGLAPKADVEDATVIRQDKAYPVYDGQYHANVAVIRRFLAGLPNLHCVGRNGTHQYNNQDHSMLAGILTARNILGEEHDVWAVNAGRDYCEEAAVAFQAQGGR